VIAGSCWINLTAVDAFAFDFFLGLLRIGQSHLIAACLQLSQSSGPTRLGPLQRTLRCRQVTHAALARGRSAVMVREREPTSRPQVLVQAFRDSKVALNG
jgi:hypothetical protein